MRIVSVVTVAQQAAGEGEMSGAEMCVCDAMKNSAASKSRNECERIAREMPQKRLAESVTKTFSS